MVPSRSLALLALLLATAPGGSAPAQGTPRGSAPAEAGPGEDPHAPPGGWEAAERRLRTALELNPEGAALHAALAEALRRQGRVDEAVERYQQAVSLEPLSARYRGGFASLLLDARQWERAELQFRQAIRLDSTRAELHAGLGEALRAQDLPDAAAEAFRRAAALEPGDSVFARLAEASRGEDPSAGEARAGGPMTLLTALLRLVFALALTAAGVVLLVPTLGAAYLVAVALPLAVLRAARRSRDPDGLRP